MIKKITIVNGLDFKKMIMITYTKKKYLPKKKNYVANFLPNSMLKKKLKQKKVIQVNLSYHVELASWIARLI